ncbi:MAG TPA: cupin domain-containing protein [Candidatus Hydrogenedentes bacterium]|nr:cupin domain-containing protein [Candidatus Hydrogenedentota bacterium]HPG70306.1 cupin domain-containing protein [Candidatus Hydrogenedentota bacterium]
MNEQIKEIAARLRELRELSSVSAVEIADFLHVSPETYAAYEDGAEDVPAGVLCEIAHKLGVDMGVLLTGESPRMHVFTVTRGGKGVGVDRRRQYRYQNLAANFIHKRIEPFLVTVDPKAPDTPTEKNAHPGQEFGYVLEGRLKVIIHDNEILLDAGDSIFFDSSCEHAMEAMDNAPATFLAVVV